MSEICDGCATTFSRTREEVYGGLCLNCYRTQTLPCARCGHALVPETHRQNEGLCFECFFPDTQPSIGPDLVARQFDDLLHPLPSAYLEFLVSYDGKQKYTHRSLRGKAWRMASAHPDHSLVSDATVNIDGRTGSFRDILSLYSQTLAEVSREPSVPICPAIHEFGLDRLAQGVAIGEENGDILFLDPSDGHSVWCYWHEGDIQRLADFFTAWYEKAKPYFSPLKRTARSLTKTVPEYVGYWAPVTEPRKVVEHFPIEHFVFLKDGRARCRYIDRATGVEVSEVFGTWRLYGKDKLEFQWDDIVMAFMRLPDGRVRSIGDDERDVTYEKKNRDT